MASNTESSVSLYLPGQEIPSGSSHVYISHSNSDYKRKAFALWEI